MSDREKVIKGLKVCIEDLLSRETCKLTKCPYACIEDQGMQHYECRKTLLKDALELLKEQEPRVLQIKEMAFLEIAVFIETNGDLEGKGTDLFLAIPYIYAVSQNMLGGYIAFVDGNTDVYDLQAIDYGKLWRCWTSRPSDEQREKVKWE